MENRSPFIAPPPVTPYVVKVSEAPSEEEKLAEVVGLHPGIRLTAIRGIMDTTSPKELRRLLRKLLKEGRVEKVEGGYYRRGRVK